MVLCKVAVNSNPLSISHDSSSATGTICAATNSTSHGFPLITHVPLNFMDWYYSPCYKNISI